MDIELMEVARQLRRDDSDVIMVFATDMAQFVVNGYAVNAFDFIVKSIDYYDFDIKMHRLYRIYATRTTHTSLSRRKTPRKIAIFDYCRQIACFLYVRAV